MTEYTQLLWWWNKINDKCKKNKGAQTVRSPKEPLSATDYLLCVNDKNSENIKFISTGNGQTERNLCLILSTQLFLCSHPSQLHGWSIKPDHSTPYQVMGVFLSWLWVWLPSRKHYQKGSLQPPGMWHHAFEFTPVDSCDWFWPWLWVFWSRKSDC